MLGGHCEESREDLLEKVPLLRSEQALDKQGKGGFWDLIMQAVGSH